MILYIAGPMTGVAELNHPAFHCAEKALREAGYEILNPARREADPTWSWHDYMRAGIRDVCAADGIALLDGWESSRGANLEVRVAAGIDLPIDRVSIWCARRSIT